MINDESQCSIATWFTTHGGTFDHYFITDLLLSLFWKNFDIAQHLAKSWGKTLIASSAHASGHCPAARWRTRFRSDV